MTTYCVQRAGDGSREFQKFEAHSVHDDGNALVFRDQNNGLLAVFPWSSVALYYRDLGKGTVQYKFTVMFNDERIEPIDFWGGDVRSNGKWLELVRADAVQGHANPCYISKVQAYHT